MAKPEPMNIPQDQESLAEFLVNFQDKMNTAFDFLKVKITDPENGLEKKVQTLEQAVLTEKKGLCDKVKNLETAMKKKSPQTSVKTIHAIVDDQLVSTLQQKVADLENRVQIAEGKSSMALQWVDILYQEHRSLEKQVFFNMAKNHEDDVVVGGIPQFKQENCKAAAMKFFQKKMGMVLLPGDILWARRIGGRRSFNKESAGQNGVVQIRKVTCPRHMLVRCAPYFKVTVMNKKKTLGGKVDPRGFKYFVSDYLTDPHKAAKDKNKEEIV